LFSAMLREELATLRDELGAEKYDTGRYEEAAALMEQITVSDELVNFLTLPGYRYLN
ncbi:MAG: malate synthase A, partial [Plesiomonas shigelloides]